MRGLQADYLLVAEEQKNLREKTGAEKILQMVPQAHGPQRNKKVIFCLFVGISKSQFLISKQ